MRHLVIWLVGCFGLNGPLRQYFSLYRAVSQREGERKEKRQMREKMSKQPPPAPTASAIGPCPTIIQTSRTPRHWKFTQHLRSTRPPPLVIGQRQKAPNFSTFHWSPHGCLITIGQHFVTMRVVHLPKRTETSLITKSDQSGPNHQLLQLCTAHTAWSDSDQAVRAVHSCISWLLLPAK